MLHCCREGHTALRGSLVMYTYCSMKSVEMDRHFKTCYYVYVEFIASELH